MIRNRMPRSTADDPGTFVFASAFVSAHASKWARTMPDAMPHTIAL